jgi:hypothetical protein
LEPKCKSYKRNEKIKRKEETERKKMKNAMGNPFGPTPVESANFVSLRFCVLDNNIRNFMCVK